MDFQDCIKFANENGVCFLATSEGAQPRVRPLGMVFADDTGFYFATNSAKVMLRQLRDNNKVEICFCPMKPGEPVARFMRVAGEVEFIQDEAIINKMMAARPPMKKPRDKDAEGTDDRMLPSQPEGVENYFFRIYRGEAYFWTPEYNFREPEVERIKFNSR